MSDVEFIEKSFEWKQPYCCLRKNSVAGFLVKLPEYRYVVFVGNIWGVSDGNFEALPQEKYNSAQEIVDAGWVVD